MIITDVFLENLDKTRSRRNWTKDELCKRMGVGRSTLHAWESGKSKPSMETLEQISKNLHVPLTDLLSDDYNPEQDSPAPPVSTRNAAKAYKDRFQAIQANFNAEFTVLIDHMLENGI